ncbi:hypothetical protein M495_00915 [Serratia liquefaciens ATCC 27592]|nr:hypothetical protein M495_00915 [Serratia liquefaciens ATCC 27592]
MNSVASNRPRLFQTKGNDPALTKRTLYHLERLAWNLMLTLSALLWCLFALLLYWFF